MGTLVRLLGRNSAEFQRFLNGQSVEQQREILAAEREYSQSRRLADETAYEESFHGYSESPAGGFDRG